MTQQERRTTVMTGGSIRPAWLIAVAAAALLVTTLSACSDEPEAEAPDAEGTIEQFFAAADYDSLAATMTADGISGYRGVSGNRLNQEEIVDEMAAKEILGVQISVESCEEVGAQAFRCQVSYQDNITEAMGQEPIVRAASFNFVDGLISVYPNLPGLNLLEMGGYARDAGLQQEFAETCPTTGALQPACADFVMDHLDDWAAWEQAN